MPNDRILVVDDEETIREIVSSMLGGAHFQTRQAASGIEALSILESGDEFDLVLSDLMMAEMDGIALLERAKERYPDMPIVMVHCVHEFRSRCKPSAMGHTIPPEALRARATPGHGFAVLWRIAASSVKTTPIAPTLKRWLQPALNNGRPRCPTSRSLRHHTRGLGRCADLKDAETEGHSRRVTAYTIAIARKMGLSKEEISRDRAWRFSSTISARWRFPMPSS